MEHITLESLLADLEKKAGVQEDSIDEVKKNESVGKEVTRGQEKSAAHKSGEELAKEIMEKAASTQINSKGEQMNKQASDAGKALAAEILEKLANAGDISTTDGVTPGTVPNKNIVDAAAQKADQDASIQPTPGTDGMGNGGTINEIFDAIVADAAARSGAVVSGQSPSAPAEGADNGAAPGQVPVADADGQEKAAAVSALVQSGVDFDEAVNLVKAAADELVREEATHIKQAAFNELLDNGVDFDMAVALIKQLA